MAVVKMIQMPQVEEIKHIKFYIMKLFLTLSVFGISVFNLVGCAVNDPEKSVNETLISVPVESLNIEDEPLPTAREALKDKNGEILSTEQNMWRNRDENSDLRS